MLLVKPDVGVFLTQTVLHSYCFRCSKYSAGSRQPWSLKSSVSPGVLQHQEGQHLLPLQ